MIAPPLPANASAAGAEADGFFAPLADATGTAGRCSAPDAAGKPLPIGIGRIDGGRGDRLRKLVAGEFGAV